MQIQINKEQKINFEAYIAGAKMAEHYPDKGNGIQYFKYVLDNNLWVDCLLYYGVDNDLQGALNFYPGDISPFQKKGSYIILVRPDRRRKGIATKLLNVAIRRFDIDLYKQNYTDLGKLFIRNYRIEDE